MLMKIENSMFISKRVIILEILTMLLIVVVIWLDEIIDIPHLFLGADPTAVNWRESLFESVIIGIIWSVVIFYTHKLFSRINNLEGILPVCSSCKKIRDKDGNWYQIESFVRDRSDADFSHTLCPDCAKELLGIIDDMPDYKS